MLGSKLTVLALSLLFSAVLTVLALLSGRWASYRAQKRPKRLATRRLDPERLWREAERRREEAIDAAYQKMGIVEPPEEPQASGRVIPFQRKDS